MLLTAAGLAAHAQTYLINLTDLRLAVANRDFAVEVVMDARPGHPPLGIAYRGANYKSVAIDFPQGPAIALTQFIQAQLPARPTDHSVLLCLRVLHVSESVGAASELATADFTADVYEHLPDGYHFVQEIGAQVLNQGREVTRWHAPHVAQVLNRGLDQLVGANWLAAAARPARALAELATDQPLPAAARLKARPIAILEEAPRRGVYRRFEQFQTNRPDTTLAFRLDTLRRRFQSELATAKWWGVAWVRPVAAGPVALPAAADIWGFSDGRQLFVRQDKQFYPLMRQGGFFTFVGEGPFDQVYAIARVQAQTRAAMMAGVVGVGLARTHIPDHTGEPLAYNLDPRTDQRAPYPSRTMPLHSDTAYVYVYRRPQSGLAEPRPVGVMVEGQEMGALRPGEYLEVPWARYGKPLRLCLSGLSLVHPCQYIVPNTGELNYLKIDTANPNQPWQWVSTAQGTADLDELDKRMRAQH